MYVFHRAERSISGETFGKEIISINLLMVKYVVKPLDHLDNPVGFYIGFLSFPTC